MPESSSGTAPPDLRQLGWDDAFARAFEALDEPGTVPARISVAHNHLYRLFTAGGESLAEATGRLRHRAAESAALPTVGDWVAAAVSGAEPKASIRAVLPRRTAFARKAAGDPTKRQVVAANVDVVLLVSGLDGNFNVRRIERYLMAAADGGVSPVVILNKADLSDDPAAPGRRGPRRRRRRSDPRHGLRRERRPRRGRAVPLRGAHAGVPRLVRGREVDAHQPPARQRPPAHAERADDGQPGPPHHGLSGADRAAGRRPHHRHPRHAGAAELGRRPRARGRVRRRRGPGRGLPLPRLPARRGAAAARCGRPSARDGSPRRGWRTIIGCGRSARRWNGAGTSWPGWTTSGRPGPSTG